MSRPANLIFPKFTDEAIVYPDSDGKPMSDNTKQYQYIITIQVGIDSLFANDPNVFVAADLLWYPVKGRPDIRAAPDTMVAFGRPKGHRGSYKQWEENDVAPQVAFEVLSPGNTKKEMLAKLKFYEDYGVQEYYEYDPDRGTLKIWQRTADALQRLAFVGAYTSPLLGITMRLESDGALSLFYPDGKPFLPPAEAQTRMRAAEEQLSQAQTRAAQVEAEKERLAAKLRELGIDPTTL
jgi:Uma2 family endonuclease